jgi:hypothetical protein
VAKTISAYDKEVSDDLYGAGTRYVSKPRLQAMLESEWHQLLGQLQASRGANTRFFSFVDTVAARNFSGTNDCHGWVGLRFLQKPNGQPNDLILHVNLRDQTNELQQEAVGILGVNMLYAINHALAGPQEFLASVFDDLSLERVEIDSLELSGPAFEKWDRNEVHTLLVTGGYAEAVVFPADGEMIPPSELLYKKSLALAPGRFGDLEQLHEDLLRNTLAELPAEELKESKGTLGLFCVAVVPAVPELKALPTAEIAKAVPTLLKMGYGVMLFREPELYQMSAFLNRYTKFRIHFAVGLSVLIRVMENRYKNLPGSLLEGVARIFSQNVRLVVHPMKAEEMRDWAKSIGLKGWSWEETNGMIYADHLHPEKPLDYLYKYLMSEFWILPSQTAGS